MTYNSEILASDLPNNEYYSLVERVFDNPETISQGEYTAIHEFLLNPDISDDPEAIAGVLKEFAGWAQYMLERMQQLGLVD